MNDQVIINDVGPRDGLQNQSIHLTPGQKLTLIKALLAAGLRHIEVGAFVSPAAVPAMAGTDEVAATLPVGDYVYSALIPNKKGYLLGREAGINHMSLVIATTDAMNQSNIRMSTAQALSVNKDVIALGKQDGLRILVSIATAWECPFTGRIKNDAVVALCDALLDAGASEITIADTIGAADPRGVHKLMTTLIARYGSQPLACHFHDTRGMALANVYAALECGIRKFDSSIAGLGGCPFAPGATGNVATEDVALMLSQMGMDTGIGLDALLSASELTSELIPTAPGGHCRRWLRRQREKGVL